MVEGEQVRLAVNDAGAAYPLTIDPWVQLAQLTASDGANNDRLGSSVAISADGGTLVAGASDHDAGGIARGAAYVFVRPATGWETTDIFAVKLTASDGANYDSLGYSVAISADGATVVTGVPAIAEAELVG